VQFSRYFSQDAMEDIIELNSSSALPWRKTKCCLLCCAPDETHFCLIKTAVEARQDSAHL
jgi:hypothetical protein